eukprot:3413348-Amphidinium_carterae.2
MGWRQCVIPVTSKVVASTFLSPVAFALGRHAAHTQHNSNTRYLQIVEDIEAEVKALRKAVTASCCASPRVSSLEMHLPLNVLKQQAHAHAKCAGNPFKTI